MPFPQVLAATAPVGLQSIQIGTFVKLVRVLLLGPLILAVSLFSRRKLAAEPESDTARPSVKQVVPWFIDGFLTLMVARSFDLIPAFALGPLAGISKWLTVLAMAALGLGVDARTVTSGGARVTAAVVLSLLILIALAIGLIQIDVPA